MSYLDLKVGDRVRHIIKNILGTVYSADNYSVYVDWDDKTAASPGPWNVSLERADEAKRVLEPREDLLMEAIKTITQQRNNTYGPPTQDFARTAEIGTAIGFRIVEADGTIRRLNAHDVAIFMIGLKLSRLSWSPGHKDNWLDTVGYAGCGWECVQDEINGN